MDCQVDVSGLFGRTLLQKREYQQRIVTKTINMFTGRHLDMQGNLENAARSVLIESPTGSGKTSMGLVAVKGLQELVPNLVVGWVAMRRHLLTQALNENLGKHINVERLCPISMFDKAPEQVLKFKEMGYPILLMVDEAQHDAASSMAHLHNLIQPDFTMGLSATPFRQDKVKLCFDKVIKDAGIHQLIQAGYLSKYDQYSVNDWNPQTVANTYLREPERWGKSLVYFKTLELCRQFQHLIRLADRECELVTGDTDIETQLEDFRGGSHQLMVNCAKLIEGFDEPSLETVFVRDSGKGPSVQMCGRVFRIFNQTRKKVVQSKHTRWPIMKTALPVHQYSARDNGWLSLTVNPHLLQINHNARMAIAATPVELPDFLSAKQTKKRRTLRF